MAIQIRKLRKGMVINMNYIKIIRAFILACGIFLFAKFDCLAVQYNYTPLETLPEEADKSDYIKIGITESYEVKTGDTLWGISRHFFGTGTRYEEILKENRDSIKDVHLLMPGDVLTLSSYLYIPKDRFDGGGLVSRGGFHIASPDMVEHSLFMSNGLNEGDIFSSDICVYSTPVTNQMGENALTASGKDWEEFTAEVIRCSEACGGRVSNLKFEKYTVEGGCDLCGYSFDFDTGDTVIEYVVFYRLGKQNMAEVVGKREKAPGKPQDTRLIDVTRYIAASFEDFGGKVGMGKTKMADNVGAWDWNYPELHNLFTSAMDNYVIYAERPDDNFPDDYEIEWKEPLFEQAVRNALAELWQLNEEERAEFMERPVMASDMAVIRDIECTLYKPGQRRADSDPLAGGGSVLYLLCNGHLEKIYMGENYSLSYDDLGYFTEAETLFISYCGIEDFSFVAGMTNLKELCIYADETVKDIDFLSELKELRLLQLLGTYVYVSGKPAGFLELTDLSVLENCKELRYLYLYTPLVTDFSFLRSCPEICTMYLSGEYRGKEKAIPDLELLPNARFLDFYEENYRFEP